MYYEPEFLYQLAHIVLQFGLESKKCDKTLFTSYPAFEVIEDTNGLVLKFKH